ncbi:hypothetical protein CULT_110045 [[Clostridium] ultunense Esp]|uniref:Erythromycin esterase n=1 Tax=[Clostridium] ultunense Esp TaxID=1288971 RepID=M1ZGC6_9FIRM|nr:hypothetical protein [Schnuerera ultunensis]CCQ92807.1 hypothetical protein CULT_110045 [[Clostridium] ultunense Esp]SHD75820.1 conserved protein of unknown function [[Clostridium] ultunense Esp]
MNYQLERYLKNNYSRISNGENGDKLGLSIIEGDLRNKEIFLTGENHGVKANAELRMKFLKYIKEKTDFRYYLCEIPYSMAYFLNLYLEIGNEDILKEVYISLKGTDAWNKDDYEHWKEVYEFNKGLPKEKRITIVGIDIEHQPENAFKFMDYCISSQYIFKEMEEIANYINLINKRNVNISSHELIRFCEKLVDELVSKEDLYKTLLGENFYGFKHVNRNLLNMLEVYSSNNFNGVRDKKMYLNFLELDKRLPKGKYFGQIGLSHVFQKSFPHVTWFGAALNSQKSKFKGKILSIAYAYHNCRYLYPTTRKNYISSINTLDTTLKAFNYFVNDKYIILKLNGENSPFSQALLWPVVHKFPGEGVTTDYFQYLIIINNSKAVDTLEFI